jgi:hypothetical protein
MTYKIFSVGFDFPGGECERISLRSERSLLDTDIIIFEPELTNEYDYGDPYGGKPTMQEHSSVDFKNDLRHWRSELSNAFQAGKTILIFLAKPAIAYVHTGRREWSGTGRNARGTHIVEPADTYSALPWDLDEVVPAKGENVRRAKDLGVLSEYWNLCSRYSPYQVYLSENVKHPLLFTKAGNKVVGAYIGNGSGNVFLVPPIDADSSEFVRKVRGELHWTPGATKFGKQLSTCLAELHKALLAKREVSPAPAWTMESTYRLAEETALELEIEEIDNSIRDLQKRRDSTASEREISGGLRRLLYEKGKQLELALLEALRLMGFSAESFQDAESEFDEVFVSAEGRFLGEAEGKDNGPINIDKLSQLERNIQEDFAKEVVTEHARGVLFGNAFRLLPVKERKDFFTPKCVSGAERSGIALVRTPDLFEVARYLRATHDEGFATQCRRAIIDAKGQIVKFPEVPNNNRAAAQAGKAS